MVLTARGACGAAARTYPRTDAEREWMGAVPRPERPGAEAATASTYASVSASASAATSSVDDCQWLIRARTLGGFDPLAGQVDMYSEKLPAVVKRFQNRRLHVPDLPAAFASPCRLRRRIGAGARAAARTPRAPAFQPRAVLSTRVRGGLRAFILQD